MNYFTLTLTINSDMIIYLRKQDYFLIDLPTFMEVQAQTALEMKVKLLDALKRGNYAQAKQMIATLTNKTQTNKQLYTAFHYFFEDNQAQILQDEIEEKEQRNTKITIQNDSGDSQSQSEIDSNWSVQSSDEEDQLNTGKENENSFSDKENLKQKSDTGENKNIKIPKTQPFLVSTALQKPASQSSIGKISSVKSKINDNKNVQKNTKSSLALAGMNSLTTLKTKTQQTASKTNKNNIK